MLTLRRQTDWVGPEAVFQVAISATGLPAGATVGGELHQKVASRATLDAVADGEAPGPMIFRVSPRPAGELTAADGAIVVSLPVTTGTPSSNEVAPLPTSGVYPFEVRVFDGTSDVPVATLVTTLLRLGAPDEVSASNTLAVGVVVPVQADAVPGLDGSPTLDDAGAESLTTTIGLTALRTAVPLTVAPSPESIQLLDSRDPPARPPSPGCGPAPPAPCSPPRTRRSTAGRGSTAGCSAELDDQYTAGTATLLGLLRARPDERLAVLDRTVSPAALDRPPRPGVEAVAVPSGQLAPLSSAAATSHLRVAVRDRHRRRRRAVRAVVADDVTAARLTQGGDPVLAGHRALAELAVPPATPDEHRLPTASPSSSPRAPTPPRSPPSSTGSPTPRAPTAPTASPPASPWSAR